MDISRITEDGTGAPVDQRRMLTIVYPVSRAEFDWALENRFLVATTPEQREAWDLPKRDNIPVLTPSEVLRVAFADPEDPVHEKLDPSMSPDESWDPNDPSMPDDDRLAEYAQEERRVESIVTVRTRSGAGPADLSTEDRAPGADDEVAQPDAAAAAAAAAAPAPAVS